MQAQLKSGKRGSLGFPLIHRSQRGLPLQAHLSPAAPESCGTTSELFAGIHSVLSMETNLSPEINSLLTYWSFSTWFTASLSLAPCLTICGDRQTGDLLLRGLNYVCRNAILLSGNSCAILMKSDVQLDRTLLIYEPDPTSKMTTLIDCATRRGYLVPVLEKRYIDPYGSKAIYLGPSPAQERIPIGGLPITASMGTCARRDQYRKHGM
jgi:hypothetical protein